jgi:hypothetical protein
MPHLNTFLLQRLDEHLALRRFACAIQTFEDYEFASSHVCCRIGVVVGEGYVDGVALVR